MCDGGKKNQRQRKKERKKVVKLKGKNGEENERNNH